MSSSDRHALQRNGRIGHSLIVEVVARNSPQVSFTVDGRPVVARSGQSVLAAVLLSQSMLRRNEFTGEARAGFCMMGACQDCWMWLSSGGRIRACTTPVSEGLSVCSAVPEGYPRDG